MFRHRPSCSQGPVSRTRAWWSASRASGAGRDLAGADGGSCGALGDSEIRADLVERVRRAIADGRYETPEKWEVALEALYRRLNDI
jgi:hypothetical protein